MTIGSVSNTPSYALTDKDRQMIDDLIVNATVTEDDIANYDDLSAILNDGKLLNVTV